MKFIYAIEVSGLCNLKCSYCPHPSSKIKKGLMTLSTFKKSLDLVKKLKQNWICLHNFGEPLIHPEIIQFVKIAREYADHVVFSTNGVLLTRKLAKSLKQAGLTGLYVSIHNTKGLNAVFNCLGSGILRGVGPVFLINRFWDWAGASRKKRLFNLKFSKNCLFLKNDLVVIRWDGTMTCCVDMNNEGSVGSIFDKNPLDKKLKPFSLCQNCQVPIIRDRSSRH